jgi:hypothetical protein
MNRKIIMRSDALPPHIQAELRALQAALETKYSVATHTMGITIENLATLCNLVRSTDLTPEQRASAFEKSQDICVDVMNVLGALLKVSTKDAFAVVAAYRDFTARVEEEILGAEVLDTTKGDAMAAIAKARMH